MPRFHKQVLNIGLGLAESNGVEKDNMLADRKLDDLTLAERFASVFRQEHRDIRDTLFELMEGFDCQSLPKIRHCLRRALDIIGPHFRYEEESIFPALVPLFGPGYVDRLLAEHDSAIGIAIRLDNIAAQTEVSADDGSRMTALIRSRLLPHVSDCDGLSIMVERLPDETVRQILRAREQSLREGLDLFRWATQIRKRPAVLA